MSSIVVLAFVLVTSGRDLSPARIVSHPIPIATDVAGDSRTWPAQIRNAIVEMGLGADRLTSPTGQSYQWPLAPEFGYFAIDIAALQLGWVVLIVTAPLLCWRGGRAVGVSAAHTLLAVIGSVLLAVLVLWRAPDAPLHANGSAWREAREVLMPFATRENGPAAAPTLAFSPFIHGRGGMALQWLIGGIERSLTGSLNPFRISRLGGAAAAGAAAFLTVVLVRSAWAGFAAGAVLALMPLALMLALSGSALAIPACLLPWSLALLLAAGLSGDGVLLAAAALAAALGTLSHTAMLAWPAALIVAWIVIARDDVRWSRAALAAAAFVMAAWGAQVLQCFDLLSSRNQGPGLLAEAERGFASNNLFTDPQWVSPVLVPLVLLWMGGALLRAPRRLAAASTLALLLAAVPFFAVIACSSDAVRYQGALLGLLTSFAVGALWRLPIAAWVGAAGAALSRIALLSTLVGLPLPGRRPPVDPTTLEHRLVEEAVQHMQPDTLVILPAEKFGDGRITLDFPDFLLPANSSVVFAGDSRIAAHSGPRLAYLGLACISWDEADGGLSGLREECRPLADAAQPWVVRSLTAADLPRGAVGQRWTFHEFVLGVPFGFFELAR